MRPNELVSKVHDRMRVILRAEAERRLARPGVSVEHALSMLEPYRTAEMRSIAVRELRRSPRAFGRRTAAVLTVLVHVLAG